MISDLGMLSFAELFHWVVTHTGALCPQVARIKRFAAVPDSPEVSDLNYHIIQHACPFCRASLDCLTPKNSSPNMTQVSETLSEVFVDAHADDDEIPMPVPHETTCNTQANMLIAELYKCYNDTAFNDALNRIARSERMHLSRIQEIAEQILNETLTRIIRHEFTPNKGFIAYMVFLVSRRLRDAMRQIELQNWDLLVRAKNGHTSPIPQPLDEIVIRERRGRQLGILSKVLKDFFRRHEESVGDRNMKEAFERKLHGHPQVQIASAMRLSQGVISDYITTARRRFRKALISSDEHGSLFASYLDPGHFD